MTDKRTQFDAIYGPTPVSRKRYQAKPDSWLGYKVVDTWTKEPKGYYADKSQAQARARTLNSRNGGK